MTITPEQLAEWKRLAEAATPGPWEHPVRASGFGREWAEEHNVAVLGPASESRERSIFEEAVPTVPGAVRRPEDAAFIASAREAVPALVSEVERLRRFAPLIDHLVAQYAERGNLDADMARIASGEAVPFTTLHAKGCNGRHDYRTRCQG